MEECSRGETFAGEEGRRLENWVSLPGIERVRFRSRQLTGKVSVRFGEPLDHLSHPEVLEDQVKEVVHKPRC